MTWRSSTILVNFSRQNIYQYAWFSQRNELSYLLKYYISTFFTWLLGNCNQWWLIAFVYFNNLEKNLYTVNYLLKFKLNICRWIVWKWVALVKLWRAAGDRRIDLRHVISAWFRFRWYKRAASAGYLAQFTDIWVKVTSSVMLRNHS